MNKRFGVFILIIMLFLIAGCSEEEKDDPVKSEERLIGTWNGTIDVPNQPLDIIVKFEEKKELTGTISIPIQGLKDFSLSEIKMNDAKVNFRMPLQGQEIKFYGTLENEKISGTFTQSGQSFPFKLEKGKSWADGAEDEDDFLTIDTPTGTLYGALMVPDREEPSPIAILIPGSGPTDRNGNSPGARNDSLKLLAEGLVENGIASLRYDKRGAGKNAETVIKEKDMRFDQFVEDAGQWLEMLEQDERFKEIIVIGHSQGSLVGMMAAEDSEADAFISIAGAGRTIDEVLEDQLQVLPDEVNNKSDTILQQLRRGNTVDDVDQQLMNVFKPSVQPFLISWMEYDPADEIGQLKIPVMIINGKHDIQVPVTDAEMLHKANPESRLLLIDGMNHVLKEAPKDREGNIATYSNPSLPLADGLMSGIMEFLSKIEN